jgi:hypothetical protein
MDKDCYVFVLYSSKSLVAAMRFHNDSRRITSKKPAAVAEYALAGTEQLLSHAAQGWSFRSPLLGDMPKSVTRPTPYSGDNLI